MVPTKPPLESKPVSVAVTYRKADERPRPQRAEVLPPAQLPEDSFYVTEDEQLYSYTGASFPVLPDTPLRTIPQNI